MTRRERGERRAELLRQRTELAKAKTNKRRMLLYLLLVAASIAAVEFIAAKLAG